MGSVWRATQTALGRSVALKVLAPELQLDAESRARFEREARVLAAFEHPGAVSVIEIGEDNGLLFLVMELVLGETLTSLVRAEELSLSDRILVIAGVAETLAAAHERAIVHRDVKPDNIIVESAGKTGRRARLVDFGLAFAEGQGDLDRMTAPDMVNGTPAYVSPEQARARHLGPPTDVYSLGITLYEVVVGEPPWLGGMGEVMSCHLFATPPSLRASVGETPVAVDELMQRMLAKEPADRPTAAETAAAIHAALATPERSGVAGDGSRVIARSAREDRAISRADRDVPASPEGDGSEQAPVTVHVEGDATPELLVALRRAGIVAQAPGEAADAVLILDADVQSVTRAASAGAVVVAEALLGDAAAAAALLRAGAADVLARPVQPHEAAKKLRRACDRARRRATSTQPADPGSGRSG